MCGIFFSVGFDNLSHQVIDSVEHRGPDGRGWNEFSSSHGPVIMAHRRLSIIDLSEAGHQPMSSSDKRYWITYNGEIYNYLELRTELESLGYSFKTKTDTEVLLKSYIHWGCTCLNKLNGMFAFVIWDDQKKQTFIARDRFGVKPLYYYKQGDKIAFASEIKQFTHIQKFAAKLNEEHFSFFLANKHHPISDTTLFNNVKKIEPGFYALHENSKFAVHQWYDPILIGKSNGNYRFNSEDFINLFSNSIDKRLIADVPVGALLSGGLDSASIVCMIAEILQSKNSKQQDVITFTSWANDPMVNETEYSDAVIEKTKLKNIKAQINDYSLQDEVNKIIYHQEEPFLSTSIHSEWNIYKTIKNNIDLKVVLDGQGADEMLCGYLFMIPYVLTHYIKKHQYFNFCKELFYIKKNHVNLCVKTLLLDVLGYTQPKFLAKIQKMRGKHFHNQQSDTFANFNKYTTHLIRRSIEPQLRWQDRASMAFSIESRQPFLDYRMVEALLNLPLEQKFNKGTTKVLLREAMHNILPDKVKNRTSKFGFPSPQKSLLNNIEPTFYQKYAKIGINIIKDMSVKYKNITPLQESCLNFTTGLWAEMFGVTG